MSSRGTGLAFGDRFVYRTPLLPLETFTQWEGDVEALRRRLAGVLERAEVREAIFLASPSLFDSIGAWQEEPDSPRGQKVERSLVRYLSRMAARPTPFGLFAAVSVGRVGGRTGFEIRDGREAFRRATRLDNDYLFSLCAALSGDAELRGQLRYWPSSSLYEIAGRLRYAEARVKDKVRTYHLVAVEPTDYLERTLERARGGALAGELAAALVADDPEVELEEARAYIDELIDSQLLVPRLAPAVTGVEPVHGVIGELRGTSAGAAAAEVLAGAQEAVEAIDAGGIGAAPEGYRAIAEGLRALPTDVEISRLFQVDLVRDGEASVGPAVIREVERGIDILRRLTRRASEDSLSRFRREFGERYETREMPLLEVLDEESGIGFEVSRSPGAETSPLLADLPFPGPSYRRQVELTGGDQHLLALYSRALRRGDHTIDLDRTDIERLAAPDPAPLPDALGVMLTVLADSADAANRGRFQLLLESAGGPSGARLLGRFCRATPEIEAMVRDHLRAEEALHPEALFAEIVHLPEGRLGNILCRPVLRDYEIPYLGLSGAAVERQIPLQDLTVSVQGDRIVLRSRRLDREVVPRMTNAHNFGGRSLGVYRFLCSLQYQDGAGVAWSWGALDDAPFLPRVTHGKLIFARARWKLTSSDLEPLDKASRGAKRATTPEQIRSLRERRVAAARALRAALGLPRFVSLADGDNELPIDFENDLSLDSFVQLVKGRSQAHLYELLPDPTQLVATGPAGAYTHELVLSLTRREPRPRPRLQPYAPDTIQRRFAPGSEWLYLKIYSGTATADHILRHLAPTIRAIMDEGLASKWFFIRYADPHPHLRLRFRGDPRRLTAALDRLTAQAQHIIDLDRAWQVALGSYERELERYGGPRHIEAAETIFRADSELVLRVLELVEEDVTYDRAQLVVAGWHHLLDTFGLPLDQRRRLLGLAREGFALEFRAGAHFYRKSGERFRASAEALRNLLDHPEPAWASALGDRSTHIAAALRDCSCGACLPDEAVIAHLHMHANRMLTSSQRAHELVLYDWLHRLYELQAATSGAQARRENPIAPS